MGEKNKWGELETIEFAAFDAKEIANSLADFSKKLRKYGLIWERFGEECEKDLRAYEEKKKSEAEIRVGDEIEFIPDGTKGVVYEVVPGQVNGFCVAGRMVHFCWRTDDVKKTGKHFPQVAELLEKMKEGLPDEENE